MSVCRQRPSAKELLRHPFIKKARRTVCLMELVDRYKQWRQTAGDSDSDADTES